MVIKKLKMFFFKGVGVPTNVNERLANNKCYYTSVSFFNRKSSVIF